MGIIARAADPVHFFEQEDLTAGGVGRIGRRHAGRAGAYHKHLGGHIFRLRTILAFATGGSGKSLGIGSRLLDTVAHRRKDGVACQGHAADCVYAHALLGYNGRRNGGKGLIGKALCLIVGKDGDGGDLRIGKDHLDLYVPTLAGRPSGVGTGLKNGLRGAGR